ncbi:MAG: glycoside hydrolase family 38 C-terminal domain-containing protein [Bacteroidota bacterium]|nr:glycoside hydrolase family 38 C-terminal domain-containing protein [Bacteroidota bacterium]
MRIMFLMVILLTSVFASAQSDAPEYFMGFAEELGGKRFAYHSPLPDVSASLIMRGMDEYDPIRWLTEVVPASYDRDFVTFVWVYSMDTDSEPVPFILRVNGTEWFRFSSPLKSEIGSWSVAGKEGAELTFNVTMLDVNGDEMGFAVLKLPASAIQLGQAAALEIDAEAVEDNSWFMTYKTGVKEQVDISQNRVVVKDQDRLLHSVSFDIIHLGADAPCSIRIGDQHAEAVLKAGYNQVEIHLPKVDQSTDFKAVISIQGRPTQEQSFSMAPVKEWEVFLVQHTHSDIGYTRPQTEILAEHLRYIDHALDYCDQTDRFPDASQFRWTCETSWSVREYLRSRPQEQVDRLLKRIREGRIEATGMFLNFSEIIDEPALAAQTRTLRMLKNSGIDVTTAMQNDVNGIAWCLVDYFHHTDVRYLTMGIHAHRARKPFNKPTTFWWQSPSGNRLLAYRSEHYMHGNALSLLGGQQDVFRANLSRYLSGLEKKDYPYDQISLQFSGYITDNSPPNVKVCDIIREWNEKYEWPKLRSALARDFMVYLDETHADDIPAQEVAWPDWWTDGVGSAANETKVVRNTHSEVASSEILLSMARMLGRELPPDIGREVEAVYDDLLFYDEHTHGAAESVTDPLAQNSVNQWGMKSSYAWEATKKSSLLQEKALAFLEPELIESALPTIAVFNTLNWERSGMVYAFIEYGIIPKEEAFTITGPDGAEVPWQIYDRRGEGAYYGLWVEHVPAMGYKTLQVNVGGKSQTVLPLEKAAFENEFYSLTVDPEQGVITSIYDKELQRELVDEHDSLSLGHFIYEELANRHELERLTNTNRDTIYKPLHMKRTELSNIRITGQENGSIYQSIFLNAEMPVCADERGLDIEIRLFHFQKKIEMHYRMVKLPVYTPEGVYVAFPFRLEGGRLAFEAQGGVVYPGVNQLAGTSSDWNTIQNFAAVKSDEAQIVFTSPDMPLVHFGDINIGRYYYRLKPLTNHIYSWVLNNYWVTNFKASQQGELRWFYSITSSPDPSLMFATRFGRGESVPLVSRVMLPGADAETTELVSRSLIDLGVPNLLMVNATPSVDGTGIVLHLREVEGGHAILDIRRLQEETGATSIREVSVLEEELSILTAPLLIEHYETRFIKLAFDQEK